MPKLTLPGGAMLRHDGAILLATLRKIAVRRSDLLTLSLGLPLLLVIARAWVRSLDGDHLRILIAGLGCACSFATVTVISDRLLYHRSEGILAPLALRPIPSWSFACTLYVLGVASGLLCVAMPGAIDWAAWTVGTAGGTMAAALWSMGAPYRWRWNRPGMTLSPGSWARLSVIGAGTALVCLLLPMEPTERAAITALICLATGMALGQVQAETVGFMTMVGHSSATIVRAHVRGLIAFLTAFTLPLVFAPGWVCLAIAGTCLVAVPLLMMLRILAYRSFGRRIADWMVVVVIAFAVLAGMAFPLLAPVAILSGIGWLARRAAAQSWLIA